MDTAMAYYRDKLGFTEFWRGGRKDGAVDYINLRTPGARGDYIELMIYDGTPTREELGTMQHVALEVPDVQQGFQTAVERGAPEEKSKPKIGRNGKWQLNLYDPDGSRTELMEPKASADANRLAADLQALRGTERLSDAQYKRIQTEYLEWIDARVGAGKTVDTMNTELRAQGLFSDWKDSVDENFKTHAGYLEPLSVRDLHAAGDILVIVAQMYQGALCSLDDTIVLYQRTPPRRIGQINAESGKYAHYLSGLDVGEKLASGARLIASGWTFSNCTSTWNGKTIRIDRLRETSVENILTRDLWAQDRFPEENVSARLQGVIVSFFYQGGIGDAELLSVPSIARYRVLAGGAIREAPVALTRAGFIREWLDMDDAEASRWSEPAALKARTPAAAAIKKNGIAWQGVSQCLAPIWEVAIRPNDTQSLYVFHISGARATALRMLAVTNKLTPGCTAIDIKSNLNSVGAELPW
ncbi:hypothetical protein SBA3_2120021 [Candidatus Sulfopaludibacter sp. SbA3]|nr:hypothetical protein SBA3_2120021 [Candidatus Sulfopaludibacter sp. SbA3]